ncbi:MAG: polysaccharide biosynthesis protein, partial [Chloroflexi bacterium]|nr:polysaccharide biosynthesis protein [Chloroflexota bacterium]
GWNYYGVAIAGAIVLTLKNVFFVPWYATKVMGIPTNTFTKSLFSGFLAALIIAGFAAIIGKIFIIISLFNLALFLGIISVIYFIFIWYIGFNQSERKIFSHYFPKNTE